MVDTALGAEFLGTYFLVFTVGCNVLGATAIWAVTSIACALMVGIYALGPVSGAHFNPAVTCALLFSGKLPGGSKQAIQYITAQLVGGVLAALTYYAIFQQSFDLSPGTTSGEGSILPTPSPQRQIKIPVTSCCIIVHSAFNCEGVKCEEHITFLLKHTRRRRISSDLSPSHWLHMEIRFLR